MIATYLVLVEIAKSRFYADQPHPKRPPPNVEQRAQATFGGAPPASSTTLALAGTPWHRRRREGTCALN